MIVQVKTLEGRLFKVEAAPEASIKAVKDIIETSQPELKAAMMKLIHSGKVLKDDETLSVIREVKGQALTSLIELGEETLIHEQDPEHLSERARLIGQGEVVRLLDEGLTGERSDLTRRVELIAEIDQTSKHHRVELRISELNDWRRVCDLTRRALDLFDKLIAEEDLTH